jgi:hypothetical protein
MKNGRWVPVGQPSYSKRFANRPAYRTFFERRWQSPRKPGLWQIPVREFHAWESLGIETVTIRLATFAQGQQGPGAFPKNRILP